VLFFLLLQGTGQAFIPETPHLLYLVIHKIKQPAGIEVLQTKKLLNYQDSGPALIETEEKLIYSYPNKLRIESFSQHPASFSVESDFKFVKISDGALFSIEKSLTDLYSDILLYRDYETLLNQLELSGVNTAKVSLKRYNDSICYVIGCPTKTNQEADQENNLDFSGLWIEKNTLLPVKYVLIKNSKKVEFFYKNWQKVSKTFYPMQIHIFLDNRLFAMISVEDFHLKSDFIPILFDINYIVNLYPKKTNINEKDLHEESIIETDFNSAPDIEYRHELFKTREE